MDTFHQARVSDSHAEVLASRLGRLVRLEFELGVAETRDFVRGIGAAIVVSVVAVIALISSLVTLLAAALSPLFGVPWEPLLIAGGGVMLLSALALTWSAWRLTHLSWPTETLTSFEENWRWLAAQLRSRLTLHSPAA
ncbi:MAG: phage holin family protein [Candidatus Rokuibacteriota bacterium]